MASKITLVESIIKVGFDDKEARRGLKRLKRQLKDKDKQEAISQRRKVKELRKEANQQRKLNKDERKTLTERRKYDKQKSNRTNRTSVEARRERREESLERRREQRHQSQQLESQQRLSNMKQRDRRAEERHRKSIARGYRVNNLGRGNAGFVGSLAATGAAVSTGQQFLNAEQARTQIRSNYELVYGQDRETALKSTETAMNKLQTIANDLHKPIADLANEFLQLGSLADSLGLNVDQRAKLAETFSVMPSAFGVDKATATRLRTNFGQIFSAIGQGKAPEFQDLRQMFEANRPMADFFFNLVGAKNADEFQEIVSSPNFSEGELYNKMIQALPQLRSVYDYNMDNTATGALQKFTTALSNAAVSFGDGTSTGFSGMVTSIAKVLTDHQDTFKTAGQLLSGIFSVIGNVVEGFGNLPMPAQHGIISAVAAIATLFAAKNFWKGLRLLGTAFGASPVGRLITALSIIAGILGAKVSKSEMRLEELRKKKEAGETLTDEELRDLRIADDPNYGYFDAFKDDWGKLMNSMINGDFPVLESKPILPAPTTNGLEDRIPLFQPRHFPNSGDDSDKLGSVYHLYNPTLTRDGGDLVIEQGVIS